MTITVPIPTVASGSNHSYGNSYTSSPIRCSPLSQPPVYAPTRTPSPLPPTTSTSTSIGSKPIPLITSRSTSNPFPQTPSNRYNPRQSNSPLASAASPSSPIQTHLNRYNGDTPSPPLSRSHPLLGSYPLSLLHSRMSHAHPPHSLTEGFALHLGAVGRGKACPNNLRCPEQVIIPFSATYYDLQDPEIGTLVVAGMGKQTPWVGSIDLEGHYFQSYSSLPSPSHRVRNSNPPNFPGYEVAPRGQLQILVTTPKHAVKVFMIPYDLRHVPIGGRLLVREKSYVRTTCINNLDRKGRRISLGSSSPTNTAEEKGRETLRYAVQVQFCCVPTSSNIDGDLAGGIGSRQTSTSRQRRRVSYPSSIDTSSTLSSLCAREGEIPKSYYISKSIRVVFTSSPPDQSEELRIERTDEIVPPPTHMASSYAARGEGLARGGDIGHSPGSLGARRDEWEMIKKKWSAKRELELSKQEREYEADRDGVGVGVETLSQATDAIKKVNTNIKVDSRTPPSETTIPTIPELDIPPKMQMPRPQSMNRGPSLLSVTSPSHIRRSSISSSTTSIRSSSPTSPTPSSSAFQSLPLPLPFPNSPPPLPSIQILSPKPPSALSISRPTTPISPTPTKQAAIWTPTPTSQRRARREDIHDEQELSEMLRRLTSVSTSGTDNPQ